VFFGPNASTAVAPQALQDALTTTTGSIDVIAYSGGVQAFATALGQLSEATPEGLKAYRAVKNRQSIDGIPALLPDTSIANAHPLIEPKGKSANLLNSTVVFLVGNIEAIIPWYQGIGFQANFFPPSFCILRRGTVQIFLQQRDGYTKPEDPAAHERGAWNVYIETDNVAALFEEISSRPDAKITRGLTRQEYAQIEFEVTDPNGYVLVFAQPSTS
jgi:hypothetical protein